MLPAGTEGKVLGYRDRAGEAYAIVEIERKVVMFVREQRLACAPRKPAPQQGRRRRPGIRHRG
jgi:hypothetical protein